jgi:apolipoprotein N-acyltransferase
LNLHTVSGRLLGGFFVAAAWVAREAIASQFPWGGFGWGRVSHGLADSPFRYLATLFGLTGASAVVVLVVVAYVLTWQNVSIIKGKALHLSGITVGLLALLPFLLQNRPHQPYTSRDYWNQHST